MKSGQNPFGRRLVPHSCVLANPRQESIVAHEKTCPPCGLITRAVAHSACWSKANPNAELPCPNVRSCLSRMSHRSQRCRYRSVLRSAQWRQSCGVVATGNIGQSGNSTRHCRHGAQPTISDSCTISGCMHACMIVPFVRRILVPTCPALSRPNRLFLIPVRRSSLCTSLRPVHSRRECATLQATVVAVSCRPKPPRVSRTRTGAACSRCV